MATAPVATVTEREGAVGLAPDVLVVLGDGVLRTIDLVAPEVSIGRAPDCDVVIEHPSLSRRHAVLRPGPPATVQDLDTTNGTRLGGGLRRGGPPVSLHAGDSFSIGPIAFVIARAAAHRTEPRDDDPLRIVDPTPAGIPPVIREVARSTASVLILGETGVGKEVLATTLHGLSGRPGALTRINCAALSESLLEAELFGHERGAFTGALGQRAGLLEAAHEGTVFLDEVGELSPAIQAKLLRAVEQREVVRLGSTRPVAIDVRFIAATNRDLVASVEAGTFRRDLFFRLDGVQLTIPPLRERRTQIARLAYQFLDAARARAGKPQLALATSALVALEAHAWPGNVRELKAVVERAVLLCQGREITARDLAFSRPSDPPARAARHEAAFAVTQREPLVLTGDQAADRDAVLRALEACAGNQTRAAKQLGISRTTFVTKLKLYRIRRPRT
jgi:DNA-binding NtrC family response regulator